MSWWVALIYAIMFIPTAYFTVLSIYLTLGNLLLAWSGHNTTFNTITIAIALILLTILAYFHYIIVPILV